MEIEIKKTATLTVGELEKLVSEKLGEDYKVLRWKINATGDYDRGTYKETLKEIEFKREEPNNG